MSAIFKILTSRAGLVVLALMAAYALHLVDKAAAVKNARDGYVLEMQLKIAEDERLFLVKQLTQTRIANTELRMSENKVIQTLAEIEKEIAENETQSIGDNSCRVTDALLDSL